VNIILKKFATIYFSMHESLFDLNLEFNIIFVSLPVKTAQPFELIDI